MVKKMFGNGRQNPNLGHLFISEIVEGVCIGRHGCSILVPSLGLSVEHIHSLAASRSTTATDGSPSIAVETMLCMSTWLPRIYSLDAIREYGSKRRVRWTEFVEAFKNSEVRSLHLYH